MRRCRALRGPGRSAAADQRAERAAAKVLELRADRVNRRRLQRAERAAERVEDADLQLLPRCVGEVVPGPRDDEARQPRGDRHGERPSPGRSASASGSVCSGSRAGSKSVVSLALAPALPSSSTRRRAAARYRGRWPATADSRPIPDGAQTIGDKASCLVGRSTPREPSSRGCPCSERTRPSGATPGSPCAAPPSAKARHCGIASASHSSSSAASSPTSTSARGHRRREAEQIPKLPL